MQSGGWLLFLLCGVFWLFLCYSQFEDNCVTVVALTTVVVSWVDKWDMIASNPSRRLGLHHHTGRNGMIPAIASGGVLFDGRRGPLYYYF
jgi:hypothetical protein